jgi:hypothetical protein
MALINIGSKKTAAVLMDWILEFKRKLIGNKSYS